MTPRLSIRFNQILLGAVTILLLGAASGWVSLWFGGDGAEPLREMARQLPRSLPPTSTVQPASSVNIQIGDLKAHITSVGYEVKSGGGQ